MQAFYVPQNASHWLPSNSPNNGPEHKLNGWKWPQRPGLFNSSERALTTGWNWLDLPSNIICSATRWSKGKPFTCFKMPEYMQKIQFALSHATQNASLSHASKCQSICQQLICIPSRHSKCKSFGCFKMPINAGRTNVNILSDAIMPSLIWKPLY
jgi:hypothetical protein